MYRSKKNKLKSNFDDTLEIDNKLSKISYNDKIKKSYTSINKVPKILYDSGWLDVGTFSDNLTELSSSLLYPNSTALQNQRIPFNLAYIIKRDINISEQYIPYIKSCLLIKNYPNVNIEGIFTHDKWEYSDDYWKIYGDSTKIYEGTAPATRFFSETDRINGDFLANNASKWYFGSLNYSISGDSYEMQTSYIVGVKTYYDVVPLDGYTGYYSSKSFETIAIDGISSSAVNGEGIYTVTTAYESAPGVPALSTVVTKNVQMTAPMFEDKTNLSVSGNLYKNSVYQQNYSDISPLSIEFEGDLGGTASLVSFSYDWTTRQQWKIFWDSTRAVQFRFNESLRVPTNFPDTTDYQSGSLPYTTINVQENPTGYPEIEQNLNTNHNPSIEREMWTKKNTNLFTYNKVASIYLSGLANYETSTDVDAVDEDYIQYSGSYVRDSENRDDQPRPLYEPRADGMQVRFIISFSKNAIFNPVNNIRIQNE